jgi:DNA polymerase III delta subunit
VKAVMAVVGPSGAGPGERAMMLERSARLLEQAGVGETVRIDVPPRGSEDAGEGGVLRGGVEPIVPALQSGSLFGDRLGIQVVDAQLLQKAEAEVIVELLEKIDPAAVAVVFVSAGALPSVLSKHVKAAGEIMKVKRLREQDAGDWLFAEIRRRGLKIKPDAVAALLRKFGSDVASLGAALDQLEGEGSVTLDDINRRFANRPDEPIWLYGDAVFAGDVGQALRRLADFLVHGHPLQLLAFLEGDLRRKAMAASAPNMETLSEWLGQSGYPVKKAWQNRSRVSDSSLVRALDALARADRIMKTSPPEIQQLTLERLTVALCRWYGGPRRA